MNREQKAIVGDRVRLECETIDASFRHVRADALRKIEWKHNGAIVATFSRGQSQSEWWVANRRLSIEADGAVLETNSAIVEDSGKYECVRIYDERLRRRPIPDPEVIQLAVIGEFFFPHRTIQPTAFAFRRIFVTNFEQLKPQMLLPSVAVFL